MLELVRAGGWPMIPLLLLAVMSLAIIIERFWTLRRNSPLGALLAAALDVRHRPREEIRERVEDVGRHLVHRMERFLNTLGTIAAAGPRTMRWAPVAGVAARSAPAACQRATTSGAGWPKRLS